ncbi:MAG: hypothetical protein IJR59_06065, partial [Firmicutes bacterium]|nr:hypothetical protein [Bacillota bacterium]
MKHKICGLLLGGLMVFSAAFSCGAAMRGDVDLDNVLTANDSAAALQYALIGDQMGLTQEQITAADYDSDN